jgi:hypothetical protein
MKMLIGDRRAYEHVVEEMRQAGHEPPQGVSWEQMREFVLDESRYTVEVDPETTLGMLMHLCDSILPLLAERKWSLLVAASDAPDLVCTDQPVALVPTTPDAPRFLGFGLSCTEVSLPLTRRAALVGSFDAEPRVIEADKILAGLFNRQMIDLAERFVFSPAPDAVVSVPRDDASVAQTP